MPKLESHPPRSGMKIMLNGTFRPILALFFRPTTVEVRMPESDIFISYEQFHDTVFFEEPQDA